MNLNVRSGLLSEFSLALILIAAFMALSQQVSARVLSNHSQNVITGKVVDEKNLPLPGATVKEKNTKNYTLTNNKGEFSLKLDNPQAVLAISYIGYLSQEIPAGSTFMEIKLKSTNQALNEVIVTGFQKIDKRSFTGSVSQIDKKMIDRSGALDVSRLLQGAAAGVSVQSVSGTFGATPKIRIRGNASISANQEPLYVVNGVPVISPAGIGVNQLYSGDAAALLGSAIAGLNMSDIEDINILKDGSATALYGTRAANGVVSITTKTGKKGTQSVNYSSAYTYGIKPSIRNYNLMDSYQENSLHRELFSKGYLSDDNWPSSTGAYTDAYRRYALREITLDQAYGELDKSAKANTDWFDVLFRNNIMQEHNLSFSGGAEKSTYFLSGSYAHDDGQAIGFNLNRLTTDLRSVLNVTSKFNLDLNLNLSSRNQMVPGTQNSETTLLGETARSFEINPIVYAMGASRSMYPYNEDGTYKYYLHNFAPFNIVKELKENFTNIKSTEVRLAIKPSYQILPSLRYELDFSLRKTFNDYDHTMTENSNVANAYRVDYNDQLVKLNSLLYKDPTVSNSVPQSILPRGGFLDSRTNRGTMLYLRNSLNFDKKWDKHKITVLSGMDITSNRSNRKYAKAIGYLYYGGAATVPSLLAMKRSVQVDETLFSESFIHQTLTGVYTNLQYSFLDRYHLETAGRLDASNMFGKLTKSKFLPNYSFGVSWNVEREKFFENINSSHHIDFLKLRSSYALRGNAYESSSTRSLGYLNKVRLDNENSDVAIDAYNPELYNLNWEKDYITNFGLDLGMFNKINLTLEYYSRKNQDLIAPVKVSKEEGFSVKTVNGAKMTNKGIDVALGIKDLLSSDHFKWDLRIMHGFVRNKLINGETESSLLTNVTRSIGYPQNGHPLEGLYAYRFKGLSNEGYPTFHDGNGGQHTGITISERNKSLIRYMGSLAPLHTGSIGSDFAYKGFGFRVLLTYAFGHKVFMTPVAKGRYNNDFSISGDLAYRWAGIGDEKHTNIPGILSTIQQRYLSTTNLINEDAYNRSDFRVADASSLRLAQVGIFYNLNQNLVNRIPGLKSVRLSLEGNNVKFWASKKLRGVDPDLLLGGTTLPNPKSYSLRLSVGF